MCVCMCVRSTPALLILVPGPLSSLSPTPHPLGLLTKGLPSASCRGAQSELDRGWSGSPGSAPRPVPFPLLGILLPCPPLTPMQPGASTLALPLPLQERRRRGRRGNRPRVLAVPSTQLPPSRVAMYDCMETFAPGPRRLYGAGGPGAGLLRRAAGSSCFAGLESFTWPATRQGLQCRYPSLGVGCGV